MSPNWFMDALSTPTLRKILKSRLGTRNQRCMAYAVLVLRRRKK